MLWLLLLLLFGNRQPKGQGQERGGIDTYDNPNPSGGCREGLSPSTEPNKSPKLMMKNLVMAKTPIVRPRQQALALCAVCSVGTSQRDEPT